MILMKYEPAGDTSRCLYVNGDQLIVPTPYNEGGELRYSVSVYDMQNGNLIQSTLQDAVTVEDAHNLAINTMMEAGWWVMAECPVPFNSDGVAFLSVRRHD